MGAQGRFHQGALRVNRFNPFEGVVGSDSLGADILVSGRADMNRTMDGVGPPPPTLPHRPRPLQLVRGPAGA